MLPQKRSALAVVTLRFDVFARVASEGQKVTKLAAVAFTAVAFTAVAFATMRVACAGMMQFPFAPVTWNVPVSLAAIGVLLAPTLSGAGRVSATSLRRLRRAPI